MYNLQNIVDERRFIIQLIDDERRHIIQLIEKVGERKVLKY
jgi:hypothetical protein